MGEEQRRGDVDWDAIASSSAFVELEDARKRFVRVALGVFAVAVGAFLVCCGYARDFMGQSVHRGLTVAFTWLLLLTVLAWVIAYLYLRFATRELVPRADAIKREQGVDA